MDFQQIKKDFDNLEPAEQWAKILELKEHGYLFLDNDSTGFVIESEDMVLELKDWLGNGPGIEHILNLLGLKSQRAYDQIHEQEPYAVSIKDDTERSKKKYFKGILTLKTLALDFVQSKGSASSTEIRKFMYETSFTGQTFNPVEHRGFYSSYFSDSWNAKAIFKNSSINDIRTLKKQSDGKYTVITLEI